MAKKSEGEKEGLARRLKQGGGGDPAREAHFKRELSDPERFPLHLSRFAQLCLVHPVLRGFRYPMQAFVEEVLARRTATQGDPAEEAKALREVLIRKLAKPALLDALIRQVRAAAQAVEQDEDLIAVLAGNAIVTSCMDDPQLTHPLWSLLCDLSLSEGMLSGAFLVGVVQAGLVPDEEQVGAAFAKALAQGDLPRELEQLGVEPLDAQELVDAYLDELDADEPFAMQYDAVLHLAALNLTLAEQVGALVTQIGIPAEVRAQIQELYTTAYADDVDAQLVEELSAFFRKRLEALRDEEDDADEERGDGAPRSEDDDDGIALQRQRAAIVWASLQALPRAQNELLQSIHVRSLTRARLIAPPPEQPFLAKLWAQPSDLFALEEYEGYLRATGEVNRAKRVSRMLDDVKRARQEARQAQGAAPEESGA
ncbi:MAG: hypothetical protein KDD82_02310 [Planctomycetes bacterium]|nr:hypothetical protein [Planctomycetota bacterium]